MDVRRLRLRVLLIAAGCVLVVEVLRHYASPRFAWLWPAILLAGVLFFTGAVFRRLEEMSRNLTRQEWRMERLFSASAVGMVLVGPGCRILRMNPAAERLTGYRAAETVGRAVCSELFAPAGDGRTVCFSDCLGLMARNQPEPLATMTLRAKSGRELAVAVSATPLDAGEFSLLF